VRIHGNRAADLGGAVYVNAESGGLCAYQFRIDENRAADGAALHIDGAGILDGPDLAIAPRPNHASPWARSSCRFGSACNLITGNHALDADGQPTGGATFVVGAGSVDTTFHGYGMNVRGNNRWQRRAHRGSRRGRGWSTRVRAEQLWRQPDLAQRIGPISRVTDPPSRGT
jgi:hypothetical protein